MQRRLRFLIVTVTLSLAVAELSVTSQACDCHQAQAVSMGLPSFGGFAAAHSMLVPLSLGPQEFADAHYGAGEFGALELPLSPSPPGTLGETYSRASHPIPVDEHPRTGMLAVRDNGSVPFLKVQNMGGIKMKSGIWLFESTRPLDPGACQIVRVEARQTPQDIEPYSTKFVRLIPGRIVYLDF